jgi:hypothetical protein
MRPSRIAVATAAVAIAAVATGCGLGPGESSEGEATLTVTHDYGSDPVLDVSEQDPPETETVIRFLDRETEITTRYGGGFVQSIDGLSGELSGGRSFDWFFFVNGIESSRGSADVNVRGGDRIWWDYRDWTDALRTPAVVGSWPEPFAQASTPPPERGEVRVECLGARPPCQRAADRLEAVGADVDVVVGTTAARDAPRLIVGPWARVRADPLVAQLSEPPSTSGVFARFDPDGRSSDLVVLDERAHAARRLGDGAGLVAAMRRGEDPPTWVATGTDAAGVGAAVALLGDGLADRYAAVADGSGAAISVPAVAE